MEARNKSGNKLTIVPPSYSVYSDASNALMTMLGQYSPVVDIFSVDEAFIDYTGMSKIYGNPIDAVYRIKDEIQDKLGFTVNIGVSTNKLLAKMASEMEKPNNVHTLFPCEIENKMWTLSIEELYMVGKNMSKHLRDRGIITIGQYANISEAMAKSWFKSNGVLLWNFANGRFPDEGKGGASFFQSMSTPSGKHVVKGIGNSGTIAFDSDVIHCTTFLRLFVFLCFQLFLEIF